MKNTILLIGATVVLFASCKNTKEVTQDNAKQKITEEVVDLKEYTAGVIIYSEKEGDCEYTIQINDRLFYDPINLDDAFKKDGMAVYFKFRGLRMANRCLRANPVSIEQMLEAKK